MHTLVPTFLVLPFGLLLAMIATGPVLYPHWWHRHYGWIAPSLGLVVVAYYLQVLGAWQQPLEALVEYVQFITLIGALYVASGGIWIDIRRPASPAVNLALLWTGALLANGIGTTGASMLLIRPYIRLNQRHIQPYHIIFFIFMVSNVGGALTPIGDPPLFLGFLKGVPFFWTLRHGLAPWALALGVLGALFYGLELSRGTEAPEQVAAGPWVAIRGSSNFLWLALMVGAVFLDPAVAAWVPSWTYGGHRYACLREVVLVVLAIAAYRSTEAEVLEKNGFTMEPLREVALLFIGIFATMMPALTLINHWAGSPAGQVLLTPDSLYWGTGLLSSMLDNAPTYLSLLNAGMASQGQQVLGYATYCTRYLQATSLAAVFFGAMTYIGNGPNFMVRAIAMAHGVRMPSFGRYIYRYALPFLLPVLVLVWWCFVHA